MVNRRRLDESRETLEVSFLVEFDDLEQLEQSRSALQELDPTVRLTYLDNRGIQ